MELTNFGTGKVLIVGDVMLDTYWHGSVSRISPEAPVPVVSINNKSMRAGGAANVALNCRALESNVILLGLVGEDDAATKLTSLLDEKGVLYRFTRLKGQQTITKLRIMSGNQQMIRLDFEDGFGFSKHRELDALFNQNLHDVDVVVLSDYAKGTLVNPQCFIQTALRAGKFVIVDPKGNDFTLYKGTSLITPNMKEFEAVVGVCQNEFEIEERGTKLLKEMGFGALLITRGENGMTLIIKDQAAVHISTEAAEVYDVTGAGDTVVATIAVALSSNMSIEEAVVMSNVAAGIAVSKVGTTTVCLGELKEQLSINKSILGIKESSNISNARLITEVKKLQGQGKKVVMTNGCFDILHPGHVSYLEEAKKLGDFLIVAINDDDSISRLKGLNRPINNLSDRKKMLSSLQCVDWVVSFSEDSPEKLYEEFSPDILVKGSDYRIDEVAGAGHVIKTGGRVELINYLSGYSTTRLIEKINVSN